MWKYSEASKNYTIAYQKANIKRIPLNVQKDYYERVLKPAADLSGEPIATYIKKAIEMRMEADGFVPPEKP